MLTAKSEAIMRSGVAISLTLAALALGTATGASAGTVPAGTILVVKTLTSISTKDAVGKQFTARLDQDLAIKGNLVARAGTKFIGKVETSTKIGSSPLTVNLTGVSSHGKTIPIATTGAYKPQSASRGRRRQVTTRDFVLPPGSMLQFQLAQPVTL
jgi:hypothetical protein